MIQSRVWTTDEVGGEGLEQDSKFSCGILFLCSLFLELMKFKRQGARGSSRHSDVGGAGNPLRPVERLGMREGSGEIFKEAGVYAQSTCFGGGKYIYERENKPKARKAK